MDRAKINQSGRKRSAPDGLLLDSSLIVTTNKVNYDIKIIDCNNYIQVYYFPNSKIKKDKNLEKIDTNNLIKIKKESNDTSSNKEIAPPKIKLKNIIRSKLECQRLAKANMTEWKSFITLTFSENIKDIKSANKKFRYFIDKVQRVKKDFKYLCITEFQKRGAVHYHILCNIDISEKQLIYEQEDNKKFLHIKYWNDGFTSVEPMNGECKKVVGYIAKYMTKDIDNRLFNRHRYFYSRNLKKPIVSYLDLSNDRHLNYYNKILKDKNIIYENDYLSSYDKNMIITFKEYL